MIDISLLAFTRARFATVVALAVLLASFAIKQDWNGTVYWRGLPQAFALIGDEGPPPIVDQWTLEELASGACIGEIKTTTQEARLKRIAAPGTKLPGFSNHRASLPDPACAPAHPNRRRSSTPS